MSDDVIKNPKRKTDQPIVKASKYVPEWQRLGKEPSVYETRPSDAMFLNNNKKRNQVKQQSPNTNPTARAQVQAPGQEHAPISPPKTKKPDVEVTPPQQTKISIGQNANWFDLEEPDQSDIMYDEIPDPPESAFEVSDQDNSVEDEVQEQEQEPESDLEPGEYAVFVKGEFCFKTSSLKDAEGFVEKLIFNEISDFVDVSIDDIMLIRRLAIKVGVQILSE